MTKIKKHFQKCSKCDEMVWLEKIKPLDERTQRLARCPLCNTLTDVISPLGS